MLRELACAGLAEVYTVSGKPYLQMCKWDNTPRASASKYPPNVDGCAQTYASVCNPRTVLPLTVTVTGTETVNRKPEKTTHRAARSASPSNPEIHDVELQTLADWTTLRRAKKAPVTQTAIDGIRREAGKAGLTMQQALAMSCERGWTGFKAEWVMQDMSNGNGHAPQLETAWQRSQRERVHAFTGGLVSSRDPSKPMKEVFDADHPPHAAIGD